MASGGSRVLHAAYLEASRWQASFCQRLILFLPCLKFALYEILSRRDDRRQFSSVVSCAFPRLMYIIYGILSPRRDDRRRDVRRRFISVLSCAFTKLMHAIYGILCRRLDARRQFVGVKSYGVSMLLLAWFGIEVGVATVGVATLSVGSIMSCRRASRCSFSYIYGIFCRRRESRRCYARRRFVSVVSCGIPGLICAKDVILCRCRNTYRRGSRRGLYLSCRMPSRGSRIVEYYKVIPKPKIFTKTWTQDSFLVCALSSYNLLSETNKFCLGVVLLLCLVLELHKTSSLGLEPRAVTSVPVISSSKQTTLVLAPFFYRA
jgi:hypothetical protein